MYEVQFKDNRMYVRDDRSGQFIGPLNSAEAEALAYAMLSASIALTVHNKE